MMYNEIIVEYYIINFKVYKNVISIFFFHKNNKCVKLYLKTVIIKKGM